MATSFICSVCGKEHAGLLLDLAYAHPADYFKILSHQRGKRIQFSDDLCVIDKAEHYIRGVLPVPVRDIDDTFQWGVWAEVSKKDFDYYVAHWNLPNSNNEAPLLGHLSGGIAFYPNSDRLAVTIQLMAKNQRPLFHVGSIEHLLGRDQRDGITLHDVLTFTTPVLNNTNPTQWKKVTGIQAIVRRFSGWFRRA